MTVKEKVASMFGKKVIKCSRCKCERIVPKSWSHSNCPKCIEKKRKRRTEDKRKRQQLRDEEITEQFKAGNINYGMEAKKPYYLRSFTGFQLEYPEATWQDYEKALKLWKNTCVNVPKVPIRKGKRLEKKDLTKLRIAHEIFSDKDRSRDWGGVDLWHGQKKQRKEALRKHHEDANKLRELINEPEHHRKSEKPSSLADLEEFLNKLSKKEQNKQ